jgi:DNA invertase Pin-like site-specific DNA recombinase
MTTRAAIYARISSDQEGRRQGVKDQEQDGRKLCAERGWQPIEPAYVDNHRTAADPTKPRPEYDRMMVDIRAGKVDVVVVTMADRLHRQPAELEVFVADCKAAGMPLLAEVRGGDTDLPNPDALLMLRTKGNFAAHEVAKIRARVKRRHQQRADDGLPNGGTRPFGFAQDRIAHKPDEAKLIRELVDRFLVTGSINAIANDWNARGIKTVATQDHERFLAGERAKDRQPTVWRQPGLLKILRSPRIAGLRQHKTVDAKGIPVVAAPVPAVWEPIIPQATWQQVQSVLDNPSRRWVRTDHTFPLIGILTCDTCGRPLGQQRRARGSEYACRWAKCTKRITVDAEAIDNYVLPILLPLCDSPAMRSIVATETGVSEEEAQALVMANADDEAKVSELADLLASGDLDPAAYAKATKRLRGAIEERQAQLASLRSESALDLLGGSVADAWDDLSQADRCAILGQFVSAVRVRRSTTHRGRVHGGGPFDSARVTIVWRWASLAKAALGIWDLMSESEKAEAHEAVLATLTDAERYGQAS